MPMIDCPDCGGTGYDLNLNLCETYDGEGDVPDDFFPEDSEELPMTMITCPTCWGKGFVPGTPDTCPECEGACRVPADSSELRDPDEEPEEVCDE